MAKLDKQSMAPCFFRKHPGRREGGQTRGCSSETCHSERSLRNMSRYGHLEAGQMVQS